MVGSLPTGEIELNPRHTPANDMSFITFVSLIKGYLARASVVALSVNGGVPD